MLEGLLGKIVFVLLFFSDFWRRKGFVNYFLALLVIFKVIMFLFMWDEVAMFMFVVLYPLLFYFFFISQSRSFIFNFFLYFLINCVFVYVGKGCYVHVCWLVSRVSSFILLFCLISQSGTPLIFLFFSCIC